MQVLKNTSPRFFPFNSRRTTSKDPVVNLARDTLNQAEAPSPTEQRTEVSKALEAGFKIGNTQTDPTVTQKFGTRNQDNGAAAPTVVQQRLETKEALEGKDDATAIETERGQNVSNMI